MILIRKVTRVGGPDYYPDFHVEGSWNGQDFVRQMSLELDGRDMETDYISGVNFEGHVDNWAGDFFNEVELPMLDAIYTSPEWKSLRLAITQ